MAFTFGSVLNAFRVKQSANPNPLYQNNSNGDLSCDDSGNLWVRDALGPQTLATGGLSYQAVPAAATAVADNSSAVVTRIQGFIDAAVAANLFVQIHNKAAALVLADVPVYTFLLPVNTAGQSFGPWVPSRGGRIFTTGVTFGVSSTRDTYTASATPIFISIEGYT